MTSNSLGPTFRRRAACARARSARAGAARTLFCATAKERQARRRSELVLVESIILFVFCFWKVWRLKTCWNCETKVMDMRLDPKDMKCIRRISTRMAAIFSTRTHVRSSFRISVIYKSRWTKANVWPRAKVKLKTGMCEMELCIPQVKKIGRHKAKESVKVKIPCTCSNIGATTVRQCNSNEGCHRAVWQWLETQ
jgi:hypothetical protein